MTTDAVVMPHSSLSITLRKRPLAIVAATTGALSALAAGALPSAQAADPQAQLLQIASQSWSAATTSGTRTKGSWIYQVSVPAGGDYLAAVHLEPNGGTRDVSFSLQVEGAHVAVAPVTAATVVEHVVRVADGALTVSVAASGSLPRVKRITATAAAPEAINPVPAPSAPASTAPAPIAPAPTAPAPTAPAPTAPAPTAPAPTAPAPPVRDLFLQPFSSTSIWNLAIGTGAQFEAAAAPRTAALLGGDPTTWLNQTEYSHPVVLARADDPMATVTDYNDARRNASYRIPANAQIAAGSDKHLHVVSPDKRTVNEAWAAERLSTTSYRVGRHESVDLAGSGIGPSNGSRAYGGSAIGGLIRAWEVDPAHPAYTGRIEHPIAMALRDDQLLYAGGAPGYDSLGYGTSKGYVWPATEQDWNAPTAYKGPVPMGTYVAIPPTVQLGSLGLTPQGLMLARAYQDYGGYVTDRSGAMIMAFVEPTAPTAFANALLGPNWSASDLKKIRAQLRVVTNNSAATPNGAPLDGARRVALKP